LKNASQNHHPHNHKVNHHHENKLEFDEVKKCRKIEIKGEDHFKDELKADENSLKVIKFYRAGCPHCAHLGSKVYDHVNDSKDYNHNEIKFLDVGVEDENIAIFKKFEIKGVPTIIFLRMKKTKVRILATVVGSEVEDVIDELNKCLKRKD